MAHFNRKFSVLALVSLLGLAALPATITMAKQAEQTRPKSSVQVPPSLGDQENESDEQDDKSEINDAQESKESQQLSQYSKVSSQQAATVAESRYGGKARAVELENEHGNLVYSVEVGDQDVKVDAGNGEILSVLPNIEPVSSLAPYPNEH